MIESLILGLSLYTWHAPQDYACSPCGLTNNTPGIYAIADGYTAGYVRNSLGRPSWYAGKVFSVSGLDFTVGAITGYQRKLSAGKCKHGPCTIERGTSDAVLRPLVNVSYQFDIGPIKPRLTLLGNAVHVSLEHEWR